MSRTFRLLLVIMLLAFAGGCKRLRNLPEDQSFLRRQEVLVHDAPMSFELSKDEILSFSRLTPNRKVLWFRFNHTVYLMVNKAKLTEGEQKAASRCVNKNNKRAIKNRQPKECKTWRMFWAYTVGEPSAVLDSARMKKSEEQMRIFLQKKGYFRSKVKAEVAYNQDSSACIVNYHVYPGDPYTIRNLNYIIPDPEMARSTEELKRMSMLRPGSVFNVDVFNADRDQIATYFNNRGYYEFNREYIVYDADTSCGNRQVDLKLRIELPLEKVVNDGDSLVHVPHKKYYIGDIYVHTHYDAALPDYAPTDTLEYDGMKILYYHHPDITPGLISCVKTYSSGDLYQRDRLDRLYKRYSQMGVFRASNIQLVPRTSPLDSKINLLDTHVRLTPARRQTFSVDPHVTNRSGNMGIYGNISYTHRNIFHGAETMDFRLIAGIEASQTLVQATDNNDATTEQLGRNFKLNTFEIGPEITYRVPRLWPFGCDFTAQSSDPQTALSAALNYQRRPDYERTLSQLRFTYNWIENPDKVSRINVDVVEFSIIKIRKSQTFQDFLDGLGDAYLANSYIDHLILATNFGYTLNTQKARQQRHYSWMRIGLSGAGNFLNGIMDVIDAPVDSNGVHTIDGIRFAQYFRGDLDFRQYFNVNEKNGFVLRAYGGLGVPRKNAIVLPFEKSFFSGGSNGLRAWQARTLGPGSSRDPRLAQTFNNIGEVKLEANLEYRFKLTKMFNLGLFVDAGNIWQLLPDDTRPGADFASDRFIGEIAIGSGMGIRLDFDYFLVRLDLGLQLKDPAKIEGERWLWQPKYEYRRYLASTGNPVDKIPFASNLVFNLGIGFPF